MSRLYPCVYCTEDGYCKKYSDEQVISWCVQSPCKDEKPSNADRIRSMSDEELANELAVIADCSCCIHRNKMNDCSLVDYSCQNQWLDWLREETNDEEIQP